MVTKELHGGDVFQLRERLNTAITICITVEDTLALCHGLGYDPGAELEPQLQNISDELKACLQKLKDLGIGEL